MRKPPVITAVHGCLISIGIVVLFLFVVLLLASGQSALIEVTWHLVAGFSYFLGNNLPRISSDAGTWGPGLAALLLGVAVIHAFGRSWARRRQQRWKATTSLALGMVVPLLFAISFLIPGVLLQVQSLQGIRWTEHHRSRSIMTGLHARDIAHAALMWADTRGDGRFPPSTDTLVSDGLVTRVAFEINAGGEAPEEPPLYLGAGLTLDSDPELPLMISGTYSRYEGRYRMVVTVGMQLVEIRADELDAWIAKALEARPEAKR